jgi:hypothetical protein
MTTNFFHPIRIRNKHPGSATLVRNSVDYTAVLSIFRQIIKRTLERLNLPAALINVPLNISRISPYKLNQPPWMVL